MVQQTLAERFRQKLHETWQAGTQAVAEKAWRSAWEPSQDIVFDVITPNDTKKAFSAQADSLRISLLNVLMADPDSEERENAWKESEKIQSDLSKLLADVRQTENEYDAPVFTNETDPPPVNTIIPTDPAADRFDDDLTLDLSSTDLTPTETQIVGELLSELNQSAVLCDHVNLCTANALSKQKQRLMLITDYRISFCRSTSKINRPPVVATVFLLDVIRIEIDSQFNIIRVVARDDDFYIFAHSPNQLKRIMIAFTKQLSVLLVGYPSSERVQMPSSYPLVQDPNFAQFRAIKRTFEALVDRSGMMLNDFLRCVQNCFELGGKALNLKEIIGSQPDQRSSYAALLVACQSLRYNCSEFDELIASYIPFGDTGMHAVAKLFTTSTTFASVDISHTACSQKSMQILGDAIKRLAIPCLLCLNLSENPIGNVGITAVLSAVRYANIRLEVLSCRNCGLTEKGFEDLGKYMSNAKSLKVIDFSFNMPGKTGLDPLFEGLLCCSNIERIHLAGCGPNARIATVLQSLVQNHPPKLKSLDISNNRLTSEDGIQLANLIKATDSLSDVSLSHCKLRQQESNYIVDAIASNQVTHLQFVLDFSRNADVKEGSVWPLALQTLIFPNVCRNIYALNLSECKLSLEEFVSVCEYLKSVNPLTILSLNGSVKTGLFNREACAIAGAAIAELVNAKSSLKILSLAGTKSGMLGSAGINPVLEALVKNSSLNCLVISNNNLSKSSYTLLKRMLGVNTALQYLAVDHNLPSLQSLWQLSAGLIASSNLCTNIPRNDFIHCIVNEKTRNLVEILSSAIIRRFEFNARKNLASFRSLEAVITSLPWIPRPRIFANSCHKIHFDSLSEHLEFPLFYHELTHVHLYECGIPFILIWLGDRTRSRNGAPTRQVFGMTEQSLKYKQMLDSFCQGRLEQITDFQSCILLIMEYLRNRQPFALSSLTCDQMRAAVHSGTTALLLEGGLHAQERSILFWICDLLSEIIVSSKYSGADPHSLAIIFMTCLYPIEAWLDADFDKHAFTVPSFIECCIKLRMK